MEPSPQDHRVSYWGALRRYTCDLVGLASICFHTAAGSIGATTTVWLLHIVPIGRRLGIGWTAHGHGRHRV